MRNKKIAGLIALVMLAFMAVAGTALAETFDWPMPGHTYITATYTYPSSGSWHSCRYWYGGKPAGIDIGVGIGTEVHAPADGTVQNLKWQYPGFGNHFEILHDDGTITLYAHLSEYRVKNGDRVKRGDIIALTGNTGGDYGPHLHFEMSNRDTYRYYFGEWKEEEYDTRPAINPGLLALSESSYAKVYTNSWSGYSELYSDAELTQRKTENWLEEDDECRIIGVGWNSKNVPYAHILFPNSKGQMIRYAYVSLRYAFVPSIPDMPTDSAKTATGYTDGLYRRADWSTKNGTSISKGRKVYLLTPLTENPNEDELQNLHCQVMYQAADGKNWNIAWTSQEVYKSVIGSGETPKFEGASIGSAIAGQSYSGFSCKFSGNPTVYRLRFAQADSYEDYNRVGLPSGLSFNMTTGKITGTPAHNSDAKSSYGPLRYYFYIQAGNSAGYSSSRKLSMRFFEPPVITTSATLARGDADKYYSQTITATGTEYSMRWKLIGSLPPGLRYKSSANSRNFLIYGTPKQSGEYKFNVQCYNANNTSTTVTKTFTIRIGSVAPERKDSRISLYVNNWKFTNGKVGTNYSDYIGVSDSSVSQKNISDKYIVLLDAGTLPDGLYLKETNSTYRAVNVYLKGVPATAGTYAFRLKVKRISDGGYNTRVFQVKVNPSNTTLTRDRDMSISGNLTSGKLGTSYQKDLSVVGGTAPFIVSLANGELPPGLTLTQSGRKTYLHGIPKRNGKFDFTLRVTGAHNGYADRSFYSFEIKDNPRYKSGAADDDSPAKPKFSSTSLPNATVGTEYEMTLQASGTQPITWTAVTSLPKGFDLNSETGTITGIPSKIGKYRFKIKAENEIGSVTKKLTLKIVDQKPAIQTQDVSSDDVSESSETQHWTLPDGVLKVPYEVQLEALGTGTIKWSKIGNLPAGLSLNKSKGIISGTPKKDGTFEFSIRAKNKAGSNTVQYELTVLKADTEKEEGEQEEEPELEESQSEAADNNGSLPEEIIFSDEAKNVKNDNSGTGSICTELFIMSDDERFDGVVTHSAGVSADFVIDGWVDNEGRSVKVSDVKIFVNDELVKDIVVSDDGTFTIPEETVSGEFSVYASAKYGGQELRTSEIYVSAAEAEQMADNSAGSSGAGCSVGSGMTGVFFALLAFMKKAKK